MKKTTKILIITFLLIAVIASLIIVATAFHSKSFELSDFEKITIYGYLEDYLKPETLYMLSGNSNFNKLEYTQSKIKLALDNYFSTTPSETISVQDLKNLLNTKYGLNSADIDFHGILISDYEFVPKDDVIKKSPNANSFMAPTESAILSNNFFNYKIHITNLEKISDTSYKAFFDILDSNFPEGQTISSGNVTISVKDGSSLELISCEI